MEARTSGGRRPRTHLQRLMARLKLLRRSSGQAKPFQIQDPLADQVEERPFQGRESIAFDDLRPLGPAGLKSLEFLTDSFAALKGRFFHLNTRSLRHD